MDSNVLFVKVEKIKNYFYMLNREKVTYILRNNINNELPNCLKIGKDIDLIVKKEDMSFFDLLMKEIGFDKKVYSDNRQFLYGLTDSFMYQDGKDKSGFRVHIFNQLSCKGLIPIWVPIDEEIQQYAWSNKVWNNLNEWWELDKDTMFVYMITRCIFDKKCFPLEYIIDIEKNFSNINHDIVKSFFEKIVFGYAERLFELIEERRYEEIVNDYLSFSDY